ncbi:MAG: hypothetical protein AB7I13_01210 [Vicinamibacterales bacterium]
MRSTVRRMLDAADRMADMGRAQPFTDPSHLTLAARFDSVIERARQAAVEEQANRAASTASLRVRDQLKQELLAGLRILARVGDLVGSAAPDLAVELAVPEPRTANAVFLAKARARVAAAAAHAGLLGQNGMSEGLPAELGRLIDRFSEEADRSVRARNAKHQARGELEGAMRELTGVVRLLDAINRPRFAGEPGLLAAWERARNVVGPATGPAKPGDAPPAGQGGVAA